MKSPDPIQNTERGGEGMRQVLSRVGLSDNRLYMGMTAILRAREAIVSQLSRALKPVGISTSELVILSTLAIRHRSGMRLGVLAKAVLLHPTTVTQLVDNLAANGMVERKPDPKDRRSILAVLTDAGWERTREAIKSLESTDFGLAGISPEGAHQILETLEPLESGLWSGDPRE